MKVVRWGNGLAIRLPVGVRQKPDAAGALARLRRYRGRLPADFRFDRLEANERR